MEYRIKHYEMRFFAGIEFPDGIQNQNDIQEIPHLWNRLFEKHANSIPNRKDPEHLIGLEIYPFDFKENGTFYYYALMETSGLIEAPEGCVTKRLKAGKYICFRIEFDKIATHIQQVYHYIKEENIKVHMGFDYEDYLEDQNYELPGAVLDFCLLMEDDS